MIGLLTALVLMYRLSVSAPVFESISFSNAGARKYLMHEQVPH
jgi:hypothetical protein